MSTTMLLPSARVGRRNSQSTMKVAPCSACAGPNTSPLKLCAIMMCSRTPTLNMPLPPSARLGPRIDDPDAKRITRLGQERRQRPGQGGEGELVRDERVERRVPQQVQRRLEPAPVGPARSHRRGDLAHLRAQEPQPPAVERLAQRQRDLARAVPAQL